MAYIGLAKPFVATLTETPDGATYSNGFAFGKAVSLDISPEYNEASLYGDNQQVENVKEFKQATITLGTTTIPKEAYNAMFGHAVSGENQNTITYKTSDYSKYVGFGCYTDEIVDGTRKYTATWIHKVNFAQQQESYQTKGDSVEFKTPEITGVAMGLSATSEWREVKIFDTEEAAIEYLKGKAGIAA